MKFPSTPPSESIPQPGIDRSVNQEDDADHAVEAAHAPKAGHARYEPDSSDRPGLVDNRDATISPVQVDFDLGPEHERRRH
jgi:hypothetical protein